MGRLHFLKAEETLFKTVIRTVTAIVIPGCRPMTIACRLLYGKRHGTTQYAICYIACTVFTVCGEGTRAAGLG